MKLFAFKKLGRTLLLTAMLAAGVVFLSGCERENGDPNWSGSEDSGRDNPGGSGVSGGSYESVVIGGQRWMKKNLDIKTADSWCYGEDGQEVFHTYDEKGSDAGLIYKTLSSSEIQSNCNKYGRLYTWAAAKKACQSIGWRLASHADWDQLALSVGGKRGYYDDDDDRYVSRYYWIDAGPKLIAKNGWEDGNNGTDNFGFSALPGGLRRGNASSDFGADVVYYYAGEKGYWWSTAEVNGGNAFLLRMEDYYDMEGWEDKSFESKYRDVGASVRCIKDN